MFFSTYILSKKGPLAKIWLAAHWDKKLTRNEVKVIDLNQTVVQIVDPSVPIALRTSGELLIGVVRIYALKVKHLLKEATDATMMLRAVNVQIVRMKEGGKDGALAVTMDLVAGKGADAVCEADFDDIADILKAGATTGKSIADRYADPQDVLGTAWFTAEPSQFLEEVAPSQSDDIARIRAEMRSFSTSDSRKSSSSNEKQRLSTGHAAAAAGDNVFFDGLAGGLGENFEAVDAIIQDAGGAIPVEDVFDLNAEDPFQQQADAKKVMNKKKASVVLDTKDTVLSPDELKALMADHRDIVNSDPRRGPFNLQHAMNITFLRALETQRTIRTASYTSLANPSLQPFFEAAINETLSKATEELSAEAGRGSVGGIGGTMVNNVAAADPYNMEEEFAFNVGGEEAGFVMPEDGTNGARIGSKRGRGEGRDTERKDKFSASAIATLEHLRSNFKGKNASTSFANAAKGKRRIEVARMFVDTLALASHGFVDMRQGQPFAEINIFKTDLTSQPLPVA